MWTLALTNFQDYAMRYKTRWNPDAYHKPMFRPAPGFSPDFTKVVFFSAMLTGDHPDRKWGDVYVAVARYPEPPVNLRKDDTALVWEKPRRHAEIQGFRLYRSGESGRGYERVGAGLLTGTRYELPPDADGFYVLAITVPDTFFLYGEAPARAKPAGSSLRTVPTTMSSTAGAKRVGRS